MENTTKLLSCHFKPSGNLSLHYFCTAFVAVAAATVAAVAAVAAVAVAAAAVAAAAVAAAVAAIVHNELWPKTGHLYQKKSPILFVSLVSQTFSTFLND